MKRAVLALVVVLMAGALADRAFVLSKQTITVTIPLRRPRLLEVGPRFTLHAGATIRNV